jgi:hypothetical protein
MLFRAHDPLLHGFVGSQAISSGSGWERLGMGALPALARGYETASFFCLYVFVAAVFYGSTSGTHSAFF